VKLLWVATKLPWPPVDGGRLLVWNTLRALAERGCEVTLVAPTLGDDADSGVVEQASAALAPYARVVAVPARWRSRFGDVVRAQLRRRPWTVTRHALPAVHARVAELLAAEPFDVVQAEQVQALAAVDGVATGGAPVLWRAQNVESDLWAAVARRSLARRPLFALEARRLMGVEAAAVRRTAATVALTREDAERLGELSAAPGKLHRVPAPFDAELPAASGPLPGEPPVVLFGSRGWLPNRAGAEWFLRRVWPRVRSELPSARLHLFGDPPAEPGAGVVIHPPPSESREAYPPGSVLAVPLEIASGVRMKILEAWARGVPVVATPAAARGLGAEPGRELQVAADPGSFARALRELHHHPDRRTRQVAAGRDLLRREHDPRHVAERLLELYTALRK